MSMFFSEGRHTAIAHPSPPAAPFHRLANRMPPCSLAPMGQIDPSICARINATLGAERSEYLLSVSVACSAKYWMPGAYGKVVAALTADNGDTLPLVSVSCTAK